MSDPGERDRPRGLLPHGQRPESTSASASASPTRAATRHRLLLGGDFRTRLLNHSENFPLDGALIARRRRVSSARATTSCCIPVGFSLGRRSCSRARTPASCRTSRPRVIPTFARRQRRQLRGRPGRGHAVRLQVRPQRQRRSATSTASRSASPGCTSRLGPRPERLMIRRLAALAALTALAAPLPPACPCAAQVPGSRS